VPTKKIKNTIGIYGDSFADGNHKGFVPGQTSWVKELLEKYDGECYARQGTSTWWNYENFLSTHEKHSIIVFGYSFTGRWPILPKNLTGKNWYTSVKHVDLSSPDTALKMRPYNTVYDNIFNAPFLEFIEYNIFKSVNEICKIKGKYLINLMPLKFKDEYPNNWSIHNDSYNIDVDFPVIHNLKKAACEEKITRKGKIYKIADLHHSEQLPEIRMCHLNNLNNILLAKTIEEAFENKKTKINMDLFKESAWKEFDPMMQTLYRFD
jgi:hypothetical protein